MIDIRIPNFDLMVARHEIHMIPNEKSGIYLFYGTDSRPLYVGQAANLRSRVNAHFKGFTNTGPFSDCFDKCSVFFESDGLNKDIYEFYLLRTLKCPFNLSMNNRISHDLISKYRKFKGDQLVPNRCQYIKTDGKQCWKLPHENGFCHHHGGNGVSRKSITENALILALGNEVIPYV